MSAREKLLDVGGFVSVMLALAAVYIVIPAVALGLGVYVVCFALRLGGVL